MTIEQDYFKLAERVKILTNSAEHAAETLTHVHTMLAFPGEKDSAKRLASRLDILLDKRNL